MAYRHSFIAIALLAGISLAACAPVGRTAQRMGNALHENADKVDAKLRSYLEEEDISGTEAGEGMAVQEAYCYKTLGSTECYSQPVPGMADRLVASQAPKPAFDAASPPYPHAKPPVVVMDTGEVMLEEEAALIAPVPSVVVADEEYPETVVEQPRYDNSAPGYKQPRELIPVFEDEM